MTTVAASQAPAPEILLDWVAGAVNHNRRSAILDKLIGIYEDAIPDTL